MKINRRFYGVSGGATDRGNCIGELRTDESDGERGVNIVPMPDEDVFIAGARSHILFQWCLSCAVSPQNKGGYTVYK